LQLQCIAVFFAVLHGSNQPFGYIRPFIRTLRPDTWIHPTCHSGTPNMYSDTSNQSFGHSEHVFGYIQPTIRTLRTCVRMHPTDHSDTPNICSDTSNRPFGYSEHVFGCLRMQHRICFIA
jgi:hypothetical protein